MINKDRRDFSKSTHLSVVHHAVSRISPCPAQPLMNYTLRTYDRRRKVQALCQTLVGEGIYRPPVGRVCNVRSWNIFEPIWLLFSARLLQFFFPRSSSYFISVQKTPSRSRSSISAFVIPSASYFHPLHSAFMRPSLCFF